ncbi:bifunctional [glutamate--ammonia ligase]-adenylyl-L-tyrosine phosphorylase/[glutamate--ammonia-ligase] adenylyltransferase [Galenea microaerophila]
MPEVVISPFIERIQQRYFELLTPSQLQKPLPAADLIKTDVEDAVHSATSITELKKKLRQQRNLYLAKIAYQDLTGTTATPTILKALSALADALIQAAYQWLYENFSQRYGIPMGEESGEPQQLIILGMGKLGGQELNFSSDIDLIFVYPETGSTAGKNAISNELFFTRLGQAFNQVMTEVTEDGFVYRVDMRLRPFGQTGPLVSSFNALEIYYQRHGRAWERYAALKARPITGDSASIDQLFRQIIQPFVYRRYTDFSAIEAIRELKRLIRQDVQKKGRDQNIKLGEGGIREAEFVVQAFQLIYGGRMPRLQTQSFLQALQAILVEGFMDEEDGALFREAYLYLRRVENLLQEWNDQQTQILPTDAQQQQFLAERMGHSDYASFLLELGLQRSVVQQQFSLVFEDTDSSATQNTDQADQSTFLWIEQLLSDVDQDDEDDLEAVEQGLAALGWQAADRDKAIEVLNRFKQSRAFKYASAESIERLKVVLPQLLQKVVEQSQPIVSLERVLSVLETILQRSIYLVLMQENPQTIQNLVVVCAASPWLTQQLAKTPALLDQLIEAETLAQLPNAQVLKQEAMEIALHAIHDEAGSVALDEELFMNQIRLWKHRQVFKVAVADIEQLVPVMQVSDHLTWIAEAALNACVHFASVWMRQRSGLPGGLTDPDFNPFMVIGYGKLGGIELGYGSDLDLVMLYHGVSPSERSTGAQALENSLYFLRLGQKLIALMTTLMPTGKLYEVDTRLRPNGKSGLMVTDFDSYQAYIEKKAWVWEHQALVRARPVWGVCSNNQAFNQFRAQFLQQPRDKETIRQAVTEMLNKMRKALDKSDAQQLDLKYGEGGIVEIEFLVQYLVLVNAHTCPSLTLWTDNIRLMQEMEQNSVLSGNAVKVLREAYQRYRECYHRKALQNAKTIVPKQDFMQETQAVHEIWIKIMGNG